MFSFNIILTEICNVKCSHCYMASSNSRKTLTKENIKTIIDVMPDNTKSVVLTGGEIFLVWDLLIYTVTQLRSKFPDIIIGLESNGIALYRGIETAKEKLKWLKQCGATFIRFSDDPFHEAGGVDLESVRKLKELELEVGLEIKYLVQTKALAIGNGATLDEEYKEKKNCMNTPSTVENPYLFLDVDGNVFICTWKCVPPIGNMINGSWEEIINNLKYDFSKLVLSGQIEEAINSIEKDETKQKENIEYSKQNGQCMLCYKNFSS